MISTGTSTAKRVGQSNSKASEEEKKRELVNIPVHTLPVCIRSSILSGSGAECYCSMRQLQNFFSSYPLFENILAHLLSFFPNAILIN